MPNEDLRLVCIQTQGRVVTWYFKGKVIADGTESGFSTDNRRDESNSRTTSELEKRKVTAADSGVYSCRALPDSRLGVERSEYNVEVKVTNSKYCASAFMDVVHSRDIVRIAVSLTPFCSFSFLFSALSYSPIQFPSLELF